MLVHHHSTLLDATCWPRLNTVLEDVGLSLNLFKTFVKRGATLPHCWANNGTRCGRGLNRPFTDKLVTDWLQNCSKFVARPYRLVISPILFLYLKEIVE